jgi:hypothetical protein
MTIESTLWISINGSHLPKSAPFNVPDFSSCSPLCWHMHSRIELKNAEQE